MKLTHKVVVRNMIKYLKGVLTVNVVYSNIIVLATLHIGGT